jgi:hypothetical protein
MLTDAASYDARVHEALREFAIDRPGLTINYLEAATTPQFEAALHAVLARDPALAQFTPAQKQKLFALWSHHESLDELVRGVEAHPEWLEFAWSGMARYHAGRGEFAAAWGLVRQHAPPPALPPTTGAGSIDELEKKLFASPSDPAIGYALYRAEMDAGKADDALATARHFTAQPDAPAYFHYLEAEAWAAKGNPERAWNSWREFQAARGDR